STPHSSGFARLASGAFYFAIQILTFYEFIRIETRRILELGIPLEEESLLSRRRPGPFPGVNAAIPGRMA
ncbi:MAG: hypothetical protein NTY64_19975, partial [Deltaproteobacteria bacterium]|nr:hypothetical protein [Deltaproteobacteria bacterium]